jgi:hypothetical protein
VDPEVLRGDESLDPRSQRLNTVLGIVLALAGMLGALLLIIAVLSYLDAKAAQDALDRGWW